MKVAVTGATGLLGIPLCAQLASRSDFQPLPIPRAAWKSTATLAQAIGDAEALVHLACLNRATEAEVTEQNALLTETLIEALARTRVRRVIFASSTRAERDDAFGKSKRETERQLATLGLQIRSLRLPNLFSETGRPFSNSVVATFAHQITREEKCEINKEAEIDLCSAYSASESVISELQGTTQSPRTHRISLEKLHETMRTLWKSYKDGLIPPPLSPLDRPLFNVLRFHAFPAQYPLPVNVKQDPRGHLFELFRARSEGQAYISSTEPGHARGNHFHLQKFERFCVFSGRARIQIRRLFSSQIHTFEVDGTHPTFVDIPTLHTHSIVNTGSSPLWTAFYADELFDPNRPDTFPEKVEDGRWLA
jgi:UDP-2-acetamido-2,6-beta-L-arabino-hexul-4-ose reductase